MPKDMAKQIAVLRQSTERLNKVTDDAQSVVQSLESFLEETSVGLSARIALPMPDIDGNEDFEECLEYCRHGGKFRIVFTVYHMGDEHTSKPWSDLGRKKKIETLTHIPSLIEALTDKVNLTIGEAEEALRSIRSLTAALKGQ